MPKKMDRCVEKVKKQGYDEDSAWAICTESVMKSETILEIDTTKAADASSAERVSGGVKYRGTKFPGFNKPRSSTRDGKKKMVLAKKGDKIKVVHYGDSDYKHNYSKEARDNFRSRHNCSDQKDKFSAAYWACKDLWSTSKKSIDIPFDEILDMEENAPLPYEGWRPHGEDKEMVIALPVPPHIGEQLHMPGGTDVNDMKITLMYVETEGRDEQELLDTIRDVLSYVARETQSSLNLNVSGTGRFFHEGDDVFHATVDGIGLADFRTHVLHHLREFGVPISSEHDFLPHITIGYIPEHEENPDMDVIYQDPGNLEWFASCVEIWHNNYRHKFSFNTIF